MTEQGGGIGVVAFVIRYNGCEELAIDWEDGKVDNSYAYWGDLALLHRAEFAGETVPRIVPTT